MITNFVRRNAHILTAVCGLAAAVAPGIAVAQSLDSDIHGDTHEMRQDQRDIDRNDQKIDHDRREMRQDERQGNVAGAVQEQREINGERKEINRDRTDENDTRQDLRQDMHEDRD